MAVWFHRVSLHYCLPRSLGCERLGLCWNSGRRRESVHQPANRFSLLLSPALPWFRPCLAFLPASSSHSMHFLLCLQSENALRGLGILSGAPSGFQPGAPVFCGNSALVSQRAGVSGRRYKREATPTSSWAPQTAAVVPRSILGFGCVRGHSP